MTEAAKPLVTRKDIRLAMIGMVEGNGHPYSWSAIFNGYDPAVMEHCPYAAIPDYLGKEPKSAFGIGEAKVTHIWTDDPADAADVAKASLIKTVVGHPEDVIGEVDAVIVATDIGHEHVERCRPFIEAGLPAFIDKPLTDNENDLAQFITWERERKPFMSSSCMRYAREFEWHRESTDSLGELRLGTITTPKSWERYGIHALEGIYPILGTGFISARNNSAKGRDIVHFTHKSGAGIVVAAISDMYGAFGMLSLGGTKGNAQAMFGDTFFAFKAQLAAFIGYLESGRRPFPFTETVELMRMIIAGIKSRENGGETITLSDICPDGP